MPIVIVNSNRLWQFLHSVGLLDKN